MKEYYVYALLDPRKFNSPFYVGKGKGARVHDHLSGRTDGENKFKDKIINAIRQANYQPGIKFLVENLLEEDAYNIEDWYIKLWGRRNIDPGGILTNVCEGKRPPSRKGKKLSEAQKEKFKGTIPWNKGLTKETNESLAKIGKINSKKMKGNVPWNKGLDCSDPRVAIGSAKGGMKRRGRKPWNYGTKGVMKQNKTSFKKGRDPWNKINMNEETINAIKNDKRTQVQIAKTYKISQSLVSIIKRALKCPVT